MRVRKFDDLSCSWVDTLAATFLGIQEKSVIAFTHNYIKTVLAFNLYVYCMLTHI